MKSTYGAPAGGGAATSTNVALLAVGGYQWFPFDRLGLYALPLVGAAGFVSIGDEPRVGGASYVEPSWGPAFTVHLGWELAIPGAVNK